MKNPRLSAQERHFADQIDGLLERVNLLETFLGGRWHVADGARASDETAQVPSKNEVYDDGKLWSLIRSVMAQGVDIYLDHVSKPYEAYSARLDAAALERVEAFKTLRATHEPEAT